MYGFFVLFLAFTLAACSHNCNDCPLDITLPETWDAQNNKEKEAVACDKPLPEQWWEAFEDPVLNQIIEHGLIYNSDISIAIHRILEERALYYKSKADMYPFIDLEAGYIEALTTSQGVFLGQQQVINLLTEEGVTIHRQLPFYQFGPTLSWEIDVFKRIRYATSAYEADFAASQENLRAIQIALSADIAHNYIDFRSFQSQLALEKEYLAVLVERKDILEKRLQLRASSLDDLTEVDTRIGNTKIKIAQLQKSSDESVQRLLTLIGYDNPCLDLSGLEMSNIPQPNYEVDLGVPSDLLAQRPDIRKAEMEICAARFRLFSTEAEALPIFVLFGTVGGLSKKLTNLLSFENIYALLYPLVSVTFFDAGKNDANVAEHAAKANQAIGQYHKTILKAVEEVQIALYSLKFEKLRLEEKQVICKHREDSFKRHKLVYELTSADFLAVCEAENALYICKQEVYEAYTGISQNFVTLCKALGGTANWECSEYLPEENQDGLDVEFNAINHRDTEPQRGLVGQRLFNAKAQRREDRKDVLSG